MLDTGAAICLVSKNFAAKCRLEIQEDKNLRFKVINGTEVISNGVVENLKFLDKFQ